MPLNNSLNVIIFSKKRAAQLDLLLRSIGHYWEDAPRCQIIYKADNESFSNSYMQLTQDHDAHNYFCEDVINSSFKELVLDVIDPEKPYTMFMMDDQIFINPLLLESSIQYKEFKTREYVSTLSLRLGENVTSCYMQNFPTTPPILNEFGLFNWTKCQGDWAYPYSLDAHIFRTNNILPKLQSLDYANPNTLEHMLNLNQPIYQDYMICFDISKITNNASNQVQNVFRGNRYAGLSDVEHLNKEYLKGRRIKLQPFENIKTSTVHIEIPFILE